jgi:hypothetical protein
MAEKGSFYKSALKVAAGLGTLAVLSTPAYAERRPDVIDCRDGKQDKTATLEITDGQYERISSYSNHIALISERDGGVRVEARVGDPLTTPVTIGKAQSKRGEVGVFVPGDTATFQGLGKRHEITVKGRTQDKTGSIVNVKGICPTNESTK